MGRPLTCLDGFVGENYRIQSHFIRKHILIIRGFSQNTKEGRLSWERSHYSEKGVKPQGHGWEGDRASCLAAGGAWSDCWGFRSSISAVVN